MIELQLAPPRAQHALPGRPYDHWMLPDGEVKAEFHRLGHDYLLRFLDEVDFEIRLSQGVVVAHPAPGFGEESCRSFFQNSVIPVLGNHAGGLFLHGSAVSVDGRGIAFLGQSRSGKTTLAGAFAKSGYPFLTEDAIELERQADTYLIRPNKSALRLFSDSARYLLEREGPGEERDAKQSYDAGDVLPFSSVPVPLDAIFILGTDPSAALAVDCLGPAGALTALLPHAFILDVEDRDRVRAHFGRLADLSARVPIYALDYPRDYSALPQVCAAILDACS